MTYTTIWLIAFLLNGDPVPMTQIVKDGDMCDLDYAMSLLHEVAQKGNLAFQDDFRWRCETFISPGPAGPIEIPDEQPAQKRSS